MTIVRADMHIHTILSPCGSLEMSPANIVDAACRHQIGIIGITDHNSTRQCDTVRKVAESKGIYVVCGAEINTREEVHCIALFDGEKPLNIFQQWLDSRLPDIPNNPARFGDQVWVDINENIEGEEPRLLISAINASLEETQSMVHSLGGIFIAAHADKSRNSVISQLGFIPDDVAFDAIELSSHTSVEEFLTRYPGLAGHTFITSSDAHYLHQIGTAYTSFEMESVDFISLASCIRKRQGIKCINNQTSR
jgi:PHP family Zn ribbon phosphoesterase